MWDGEATLAEMLQIRPNQFNTNTRWTGRLKGENKQPETPVITIQKKNQPRSSLAQKSWSNMCNNL